MRLKFIQLVFFVCSIMPLIGFSANTNNKATSSATSGQFTFGGSFLLLQAAGTDGDFQYGTVVGPVLAAKQVTNAHMLTINPSFKAASDLSLAYQFANSPYNISATYFHYSHKFNKITNASLNPFIQNFLGGAFVNGQAALGLNINQVNVGVGKICIATHHLIIHPTVGLSYLAVGRKLNVRYTNFIFSQQPSALSGAENSNFYGGGVFASIKFNYLITHHFHVVGYLGSGLYIGNLNSKLNANFQNGASNLPYNASYHDGARFALAIKSRLGFNYQFVLAKNTILSFELGYYVNDFINSIERINPLNGFANNPDTNNPPAINNGASVGTNGPYARLNFLFHPNENLLGEDNSTPTNSASKPSGLFIAVMNSAAKPIAQNADSTYAEVVSDNRPVSSARVSSGYGWNGQIKLGYLFKGSNADLAMSYSHLDSTGANSVVAGAGQSIISLNSSGIATVGFAQANSHVRYCLNNIRLMAGQNFAIRQNINLHVFTGLEYASVKRIQNNSYLGGNIDDAKKYPVLVSSFQGMGPLFGLDAKQLFSQHFAFVTHLATSLLFGNMYSTLNQRNFYSTGQSTSNTLSSGDIQAIVPTVAVRAGFLYRFSFSGHCQAAIQAGYQAQYYFKVIDLLYPNFTTGLNQRNTSLGVIGPYIIISVRGI